MKNSNSKMQYIKHISECLNDGDLNDLQDLVNDSQMGDSNNGAYKEFVFKVYDITEIEEKMFELRRELEDNRNNIKFFEGSIKTIMEELKRLEAKLKYLGQ